MHSFFKWNALFYIGYAGNNTSPSLKIYSVEMQDSNPIWEQYGLPSFKWSQSRWTFKFPNLKGFPDTSKICIVKYTTNIVGNWKCLYVHFRLQMSPQLSLIAIVRDNLGNYCGHYAFVTRSCISSCFRLLKKIFSSVFHCNRINILFVSLYIKLYIAFFLVWRQYVWHIPSTIVFHLFNLLSLFY